MLILASIFSLNVFAEDVDYNSVIGINVDGDTLFYSDQGIKNVSWGSYIEYYKHIDAENCPFGIFNGYVVYGECFIVDSRTKAFVKENENYYVSSNRLYDVHDDNFITREKNGRLIIHSNAVAGYEKITFNDLIGMHIQSGYSRFFYSIEGMEIYYNSCLISYPNGSSVTRNDYVNYDIEYVLIDPCNHVTMDVYKIIKANSCVEKGEQLEKCVTCGFVKTTEIPIDLVNGHFWQSTSYAGPTCVKSGIEILTCKYCSKTTQEVLKPLGHKHISPTCTEDAQCIRCGVIVETALGHNLRHGSWGKCLRNGCDYRLIDVQGALNSAGTYFNNWWKGDVEEPTNNVIEQVKQDVEESVEIVKETLSNIGNGASNLWQSLVQSGNNIKQFFSNLFSISAVITIVLLLIIGLNYGIGFYNSINTFKDIRRRKKRRKKNKKKKKIKNKEIKPNE